MAKHPVPKGDQDVDCQREREGMKTEHHDGCRNTKPFLRPWESVCAGRVGKAQMVRDASGPAAKELLRLARPPP